MRCQIMDHEPAWQLCDAVLFYEPLSSCIWLVPVSILPPSGSIVLGRSYDQYRLFATMSAVEEKCSINDVLQAAIEEQKRRDENDARC